LTHRYVNHSAGEVSKWDQQLQLNIHTNNIENVWSRVRPLWKKRRGERKEKILQFVKEMMFRINNTALFPLFTRFYDPCRKEVLEQKEIAPWEEQVAEDVKEALDPLRLPRHSNQFLGRADIEAGPEADVSTPPTETDIEADPPSESLNQEEQQEENRNDPMVEISEHEYKMLMLESKQPETQPEIKQNDIPWQQAPRRKRKVIQVDDDEILQPSTKNLRGMLERPSEVVPPSDDMANESESESEAEVVPTETGAIALETFRAPSDMDADGERHKALSGSLFEAEAQLTPRRYRSSGSPSTPPGIQL